MTRVYLCLLMNSYSSPYGCALRARRAMRGRSWSRSSPVTPTSGWRRPCRRPPIRRPGRCRGWPGSGTAQVEPLNTDRLASETDVVFLAVPEQAAAELAPPLVDAGVRVIDLSGAFRIRDAAARSRWYPATQDAAGRRRVRPDGALQRRRAAARRSSRIRAAIRRRALLALLPLAKAGLLDTRAASSSTRSRAFPAPGARRAIARTFPRITARSSAYGVFGHRHVAEMEQELGAPMTFVPHLVPLDRGILETIYCHAATRHHGGTGRRRVRGRLPRRAVRPADRRRAAGDQACRVDEFLRHRLATRRGIAPPRARGVPRQSREGRGGSGASELQRRLRFRRTDGAAVNGPSS